METIPVECYPDLNDFIRIGKRLISQRRLRKKSNTKVLIQREKICLKICDFKSEHFSFKINEHSTYQESVVLIGPVRDPNNIYDVDMFVFIPFGIVLNSFLNQVSLEYQEELEALIRKVRSSLALDFYILKQLKERADKISHAVGNKFRAQELRIKTIEKLWDEAYLKDIPPGAKILYRNKYETLCEGIFVKYYVDGRLVINTYEGEYVVGRDRVWYKKFTLTDLQNAIIDLHQWDQIPDCWKENKLDFYDVNSI